MCYFPPDKTSITQIINLITQYHEKKSTLNGN